MTERVEPIPDGYVEIMLVHPSAPLYRDPEPSDYYVRYYFKDIDHWNNTRPDGLHFYYDKHTVVVPWTNIREYELHYNSQEYRAALADWQLSCDHDWEPHVDFDNTGEPYNWMLCPKCRTNDAQIRRLEQERADRERGLA